MNNKRLSVCLWLCFCLSLLILSLGLSWQVNKSANFFYGFWYSNLNIEETIKTYAPQNKYGKQDFVKTDRQQHVNSFHQIVYEINNNGTGLETLTYLIDDKQHKLLTKAEVVHLQDVSDLVNKLRLASTINLLFFLIIFLYVYRFKQPKPNKKQQLMVVIFPSIGLLFIFVFFGFTEIFYYLHTLVFPDNHQWFFYYQESLMSSLMKAPDLFAGIGVTLVTIACVIYMTLYRLLMTTVFRE